MGIPERIKRLREYFCNGSNQKFAELMKEKPNVTSTWVSGKRNIGRNVLDKILSNLPEVNASWLLTGEGAMLNTPMTPEATPIRKTETSDEVYLETNAGVKYYELANNKYKMKVPLVPFNAHARFIDESCSGQILQDREEWEEVEFIVDQIGHGKYVSFEVKGDSMDDDSKRSFSHGDLVLARELNRIYWKEGVRYHKFPYWVIVLKNSILIKEIIHQDLKTGEITCHSLNDSPEYTDFTVHLDEVCSLFNVIKKISSI